MSDSTFHTSSKAAIAGGTLTVILMNISSGDVLKTMVLAAIGAVVSFSITLLMKTAIQRFKK